MNDCLIEKQASVFSDSETLIGHKLIIDCPSRWNSSLDMLRRILEQTSAIVNIHGETLDFIRWLAVRLKWRRATLLGR